MKLKVDDLSILGLNWAAAVAMGKVAHITDGGTSIHVDAGWRAALYWHPCTSWDQAGPIIEREQIGIWWYSGSKAKWVATRYANGVQGFGRTPLEAAMRCFVTSKLGDEVEVPDEMLLP